MTQEDKELLLKDLCARLPYGVKIYFGGIPKLLTSITVKLGYTEILVEGEYGEAAYCDFISTYNNKEYLQEEIAEKCKPYLRPMSSMTEEEKEELLNRLPKYWGLEIDKLGDLYFDICDAGYPSIELLTDIIDWLNAHHFDYRSLIERGLAIDCTGLNVY